MGRCQKIWYYMWNRDPLVINIPVQQEIYCKKSALSTEFFMVCAIIALFVSYAVLQFHLQQTVTTTVDYDTIVQKKMDPVKQQCMAQNVSVDLNSFIFYDYNTDYYEDVLIKIPNLTHDKYMWITANTATYNLQNKFKRGWAINSDYIISEASIVNMIQQQITSDDFMIWNIETDTMLVTTNLLWKITTVMGWKANITEFMNASRSEYNIFVMDEKYLPVIANQMMQLITIHYPTYLRIASPYNCVMVQTLQDSSVVITAVSLIGSYLSLFMVICNAFVNFLDNREYDKLWQKYKKGERTDDDPDETKITRAEKDILANNCPHYGIAMHKIDEERLKGKVLTDKQMQHILHRKKTQMQTVPQMTPAQLSQVTAIANLIVTNPELTAHITTQQLTKAQIQRVATMAQLIQDDPELSAKLPSIVTHQSHRTQMPQPTPLNSSQIWQPDDEKGQMVQMTYPVSQPIPQTSPGITLASPQESPLESPLENGQLSS